MRNNPLDYDAVGHQQKERGKEEILDKRSHCQTVKEFQQGQWGVPEAKVLIETLLCPAEMVMFQHPCCTQSLAEYIGISYFSVVQGQLREVQDVFLGLLYHNNSYTTSQQHSREVTVTSKYIDFRYTVQNQLNDHWVGLWTHCTQQHHREV